MLCTLCTKQGIPCIRSSTTTDACDACQQAHKKCSFIFRPFQPRGQRSSHPRCPQEDSFVVDDYESIPELEWTPGPQTGQQEQFLTIGPVLSSIDLSTHHPMVTSLLDRSKVIIQLSQPWQFIPLDFNMAYLCHVQYMAIWPIWPFMAISSSGPNLGLSWPFSTFGQFWYSPVNR
ncbi:hypothetical protein O181_080556 [Austropuccinia psidii MF-1]|uniref:Zn(2)-C6 fungal-type domain-containing protein n=1 Tax=Austropuccinia psidii MF-1 TaxID=1389203 RepID=A0A9Q3FIF6_9BASI|nr:hypothetical protein [Austropuccinia psidii MF-1]